MLLNWPISYGRKHAIALDVSGGVWLLTSWGRPSRMVSPLPCSGTKGTSVVQVECGWTFCVVLTQSGEVFAWWPFEEGHRYYRWVKMKDMNSVGDSTEGRPSQDWKTKTIQCSVWDDEFPALRLPPIPTESLPGLRQRCYETEDSNAHQSGVKLVKLAAMAHSLVGVTNEGHVLVLHGLFTPEALTKNGFQWQYVCSSFDLVNSH